MAKTLPSNISIIAMVNIKLLKLILVTLSVNSHQHITEKDFKLTCYYGFFANQVREVLLQKVYELLDQVVEEVKFLG